MGSALFAFALNEKALCALCTFRAGWENLKSSYRLNNLKRFFKEIAMHTFQIHTATRPAMAFRHFLQIVQKAWCNGLHRLATVQLSAHRSQHMH
jgi:hypothetical protein